jgi:sulfur relay (sulfurtransferase) complex TusBCD TusD component (DsrE family)
MQALSIVNDPPYGTERLYNALRLAEAFFTMDSELTIFLLGDAVLAAKANQKTPNSFYNVECALQAPAQRQGFGPAVRHQTKRVVGSPCLRL